MGRIEIIWPSTTTDFLDAQFPTDTRCQISGAITSYYECTKSSGDNPVVYTIVLDRPLVVEPGSLPVIFTFPDIYNFNAELSSGVIQVKTMYDGYILDESGNDPKNRKAVTGRDTNPLEVVDFTYNPKTEAISAVYEMEIDPKTNLTDSTVLMFTFPYEFPRGIGESISCFSEDLHRSPENPIRCNVEDWVLNVTNIAGLDYLVQETFTLSIKGIVNPN